ncbi:hypothetical protein [Brachyspira hampsonii]|uniref:hypothetical protein n=1 Tax=Brachyspira hampsonii TaxID=1287055 RepID=UPI000D3484CB|nr:hypothetical protein [Brachyspira hampsonii]PTY39170.1 hypothetical protein DQ06_00570 [Brachyspira hampsonii bv. II]
MNDREIEKIWRIITDNYNKYLSDKGVKLPSLKDKNGYTKNALVLVRLAKNYPNTDIVSKSELTDFIKEYYPDVNDVQQARHLSMQSGFNIVSGTRGDSSYNIHSGSYKLIDLENPYPAFSSERREGFSGNWEKIKELYNYRCASCGSKEGDEHLFRKGVKVSLQKGHMNPALPLEEGNIIPQCQICNRPDRNKWIYDKTGRVIGVANTEDGFRIVEKFIKNSSEETNEKLFKLLIKILKK